MRDRFVILPFSVGCVSQSSVSVSNTGQKKQQQNGDQKQTSGRENTGKVSFQRPNLSFGFNKLIKNFKLSISNFFANFYELEEKEQEREMVIGYPTDVQHVAHIGLDGLSNVNHKSSGNNNWSRARGAGSPLEFLSLDSLSSLSLGQFEMAMEAQTGGDANAKIPNHGSFGLMQL